jgi:hypothetical protein
MIAAFAIVTGSTLIAAGIEVRHKGRTALSSVSPAQTQHEAHARAS